MGGKTANIALGRRIASLAGRQHGVVGVHQLYALGVSRRRLERRVADGTLIRVHRGP